MKFPLQNATQQSTILKHQSKWAQLTRIFQLFTRYFSQASTYTSERFKWICTIFAFLRSSSFKVEVACRQFITSWGSGGDSFIFQQNASRKIQKSSTFFYLFKWNDASGCAMSGWWWLMKASVRFTFLLASHPINSN